jgi:hypothetical protein
LDILRALLDGLGQVGLFLVVANILEGHLLTLRLDFE